VFSDRKIYWALAFLLAVSAVARGFLAGFLEFGNDEVYYLNYALFPDLSHFDHPPMVGLVIQLFTLNLTFDSEFFVRLAAVVLGTVSTWLIFLVGRQVKDALTGLYASLLYTASFYGFILSGTFILPDAPQVCLWLATVLFLLKALPDEGLSPASRRYLLLAGVTTGLALLSKYHSIFLAGGMAAYVIFYNRKWFRAKEFYLYFLLVILLTLPVAIWNYRNGFISFTYHENRVSITGSGLRPQYFLTEIAGEIFYNNPVNVVIIITGMIALFLRREIMTRPGQRILLWTSLPLILVFQSFSLFRSTLPHWTGPGYLGLIVIAAAYLAEPSKRGKGRSLVPWPLALSLALLVMVAVTAAGQIRYGWIPVKEGKGKDPSRDLYGWKQLGDKFDPLAKKYEDGRLIRRGSPILTFRWFPAANFDYYLGRQTPRPVYAIGTLERIHKYYWINHFRGNLQKGSDAWFIALSDDYEDPAGLYGNLFTTILPPDTLYITRGGDTIRKAFVFRMLGLKQPMVFGLDEITRKE
jgi:hypothetical protein